jgi:hypothetical protein
MNPSFMNTHMTQQGTEATTSLDIFSNSDRVPSDMSFFQEYVLLQDEKKWKSNKFPSQEEENWNPDNFQKLSEVVQIINETVGRLTITVEESEIVRNRRDKLKENESIIQKMIQERRQQQIVEQLEFNKCEVLSTLGQTINQEASSIMNQLQK